MRFVASPFFVVADKVNHNHRHNIAISTTTNNGIFTGMPGGTFQPGRYITCAEFAVAMSRLMGLTLIYIYR